jgi:hypothetical protein
MKENGGMLDEVIFAVKTDNQEDIAYLDELVAKRPYTKFVSEKDYGNGGWDESWEPCKAEHIYVKIDDDVVSDVSYDIAPYSNQHRSL